MDHRGVDLAQQAIKAVEGLQMELRHLGNGDAATSVGAIEGLAMKIEEGCQRVADGLNNIADAIRESKG